ncbi:MAG TPA: S41 family peptidase [Candidatus Angelobacter sp.]|nr:S41 family peptidase [Candidatus Angelobacter sp.]
MSKTTKLAVLGLSFLLATLVVAGGLGVKASTNSNDDSYRQIEVYSEVLSRIRTEYVEDPNVPAVTNGALHGLLESLDANSSYLDPTEYKDYKQRKNDGKATIGATLSKRFGYAVVVAVIPGGPADKASIETGDIIEAIEGKSTRDMSLAEIDGILAGQPGSVINLSVVRPRKATPTKAPITREIVAEPPVNAKMLEDGIGYIKIDDFPKGRSQDVSAKFKELEKMGAKKLVLDLRNSGTGDESEGVATANLFLNHGMISYLEGQKYPKQTFNADPQKAVAPSIPLVVLVNRGTAGPAEIVAAAVMENARGDVVGDKTFGSGSIQKVIEMQDGSALILSVAKYYSPSGKALQDTAVTPNILVADNSEDFIGPDDDETGPAEEKQEEKERKTAPDDQLKKAIDVLKNPAQVQKPA